MDIFKQLSSGADVDMAKPEYVEAIKDDGTLQSDMFPHKHYRAGYGNYTSAGGSSV